MSIEVKLPNLGENIDSGDIVSVLVKEGDEIGANQGLIEIETGKATVEIPSPQAGRVAKVHVKQGQTVQIGAVLVALEGSAGGDAKKADKKPEKKAEAAKPAAEEAKKPAAESKPAEKSAPAKPAAAPAQDKYEPVEAEQDEPSPAAVPPYQRGTPPASNGGPQAPAKSEPTSDVSAAAGPSTRRLARELGVDIHRIKGTGPSGRITREDIVAAVRQSTTAVGTPAGSGSPVSRVVPEGVEDRDDFGTVRRQPLTRIRKTIAANMVRSTTTIPHVTNFDDADITELERIRKGSASDFVDSHIKLTMMPFVMKAIAQALRLHPLMNASLDMENGAIVFKDYIHLGVAVDTDRGLVVPTIRDVDRLSIPQIAQALADVAAKARENRFTLEDQLGGTFTVSNLGAIGGTYSTPIINPPQVAILLLGRSRTLPVVIDDEIEPRLMMPLSISYDHRLIDGAAAARFLNEVKNYLQVPGRLLLAQ